MMITEAQVKDVLKQIVHPEKQQNIISLEMVDSIQISEKTLQFALVFARPNDPLRKSIKKACESALSEAFGPEIQIEIEMPLKFSVVSNGRVDDGKVLPGVKNIIAIASGKGGVGKSTVAANLAVALAATGARVGLIDTDVYGPSIPKMFHVEEEKPVAQKIDGKDKIVPVESYGVKLMSIGFFVDATSPVIWRGPMATSALKQFINDCMWGELDYLLLDLPPGTGDVHLTLVQEMPLTGAVIVCTPQDVALADAVKGINMFRSEKINVPILGLIENMAWFTPEDMPEKQYFIFGKDGGKRLAEKMEIALLGQIPLIQNIREGGDYGQPSALNVTTPEGKAFELLAKNIVKKVEDRNILLAPTQKVEITNTEGCAAPKH